MAECLESKWQGKVTAELKGIKAEQVWPFLEDFCNINKWFPFLVTCNQVEGEQGKPGLVRHCTTVPQVPDFDVSNCDGNMFSWAKERLAMIDPIQHCLTYEIIENNMGIKSYFGTFKLFPLIIDGGNGDEEDGCRFEWSIVADPIDGFRFEDYEFFRTSIIQLMIKNLQTLISMSL